MNSSNSVVLNEKCGFFDIDCNDGFRILTHNDDFSAIVGRDAEKMCYLDIVCPEDRESVSQRLAQVFSKGRNGASLSCMSVRHRIILPDGAVITVILNIRYAGGLLACTLRRAADIFTEDGARYKSNSIIESMPVSMAIVFVTDGGHIIIKCANEDFYKMIGWNRFEFSEFFNDCLNEVIYPQDCDLFIDNLRRMTDTADKGAAFEARTVIAGGGTKWNAIRAKYLSSEDERPVISLVFDDISECRRLQSELTVQNERFNIIQRSTEQIIFDYNTSADQIVFSGNVGKMLHALQLYDIKSTENEMVVNKFIESGYARSFMNEEHYEMLCQAFANAIITGVGGAFDLIISTSEEQPGIWHKCIFSPVTDEFGETVRIVGRFKNIDKQKKNEIIMEKRIHCDMLTGLLNKETAINLIREFLDGISPKDDSMEKLHALMIIDMDNVRIINDSLGHTFGDSVIQEFASDIKSSFRDTDIVGRIGGDEFIVLMKNVTLKSASKKAGRICRSMVKNYCVDNRNISLGCSIGMAFFGKDADNFDDLYKYADIAMYNAKVNGRCSYVIYDSENIEMHISFSEVQNRTQMDPPTNVTETNELDTNLMDIAFSLVAASDDILSTLDILIRTVGRKYNLSAVTVLVKKDYNEDNLKVISRWHSARYPFKSESVETSFDADKNFDRVFNGSNLKCISDISSCSNLTPAAKNSMKNANIGACVIGRLEGRSGSHYGYIVFHQLDRKRKWSRKESNTFKYITKIISIALVEKHIKPDVVNS
ncbi:MAG: diguanylate cyclase [Firmicutes bacterium]|nr:diguanylate cyclase [Bacillota bacterium]